MQQPFSESQKMALKKFNEMKDTTTTDKGPTACFRDFGMDFYDEQNRDVSVPLHKGLTDLWQSELCTDFEIKTDTKSFRCHKVVLAAVSDYFRAMFNSGMKEATDNTAQFDDISAKTFEAVFELLYPNFNNRWNGLKHKSEEDAMDLLKLACRFQMKFLIDICIQFIASTMSAKNCVGRWKIGQLLSLSIVEDMAWKYILHDFAGFVKECAFLELDFKGLHQILSDVKLNVGHEYFVWVAIKRWIEVDKRTRKKHFISLLKECCILVISESIIIEYIAFDPLVRLNDEASLLVHRRLILHKHLGMYGNVEFKFRKCHKQEQSLIALCESKNECRDFRRLEKKEVGVTVDVNMYSVNMEVESMNPLKHFGTNLTCCVHGNALYVVGGPRMTMMKLCGKAKTWSHVSDFPSYLEGHTMTAADDKLFVLGGRSFMCSNQSVFAYIFDNKEWKVVGEPMVSVFGASSVYVNGKIYVIGGEFEGKPTDCIQIYDTRTNTGTILCSMPCTCKFSLAVCRGNSLYIVLNEGTVLRVCATNGTCQTIALVPNFKRINFGMNLRNGKILIFGGKACVATERQVITNDKKTKYDALFDDFMDCQPFEDQQVRDVIFVDIKTGEISGGEPLTTDVVVLGCGLVVHDTIDHTEAIQDPPIWHEEVVDNA